MTFYNLELADTNVADHNTHEYCSTSTGTAGVEGGGEEGVEFVVEG